MPPRRPPAPIDPGALLGRTWSLGSGLRVRLRLARRGDAPAIRALLDRCGVEASDLQIERLIRADPRREVTLCAMAPIDGREEDFVGVGAIAFGDGDGDGEPHTVTCDERMHPDGAHLMGDALRELVRRRARRVA